MKLLFENWRGYLLENKNWSDITIGDLEGLIQKARKKEDKRAYKLLAKLLGKEVAVKTAALAGATMGASIAGPAGAAIGGGVGAGAAVFSSIFKSFIDKKRNKPEGEDTEKDFPILSVLKIDPELIKTIEDDILEEVDEGYEKYLARLSKETKVSEIRTINDYVRWYIAWKTNNKVVIQDKSGAV